MKDVSAEDLRLAFPEEAFALETVMLESDLVSKLAYNGYIRKFAGTAEIIIKLSGNHELVISPGFRTELGAKFWGSVRDLRSAEDREVVSKYVISTVCQLRHESRKFETIAEFRIEATSLERVVSKFLYSVQKVCRKRLVPLPIETII